MFQLTKQEKAEVVAKCDHLQQIRFSSTLPYVFTEYGAVMLASILNSDRAIIVNIQIVRVFTRIRKLAESYADILGKLDLLQKNDIEQDKKIQLIFEYLKELEESKKQETDIKERKRIGY